MSSSAPPVGFQRTGSARGDLFRTESQYLSLMLPQDKQGITNNKCQDQQKCTEAEYCDSHLPVHLVGANAQRRVHPDDEKSKGNEAKQIYKTTRLEVIDAQRRAILYDVAVAVTSTKPNRHQNCGEERQKRIHAQQQKNQMIV